MRHTYSYRRTYAWILCASLMILATGGAVTHAQTDECPPIYGHLGAPVSFEKGYSNPIAGNDDRLVLKPENLQVRVGKLDGQALKVTPTLLVGRKGEDLEFVAKFRSPNSFARAELGHIEGEAKTVTLAANAKSISLERSEFFPEKLNTAEELAAVQQHAGSFFGLNFIARADRPFEGRLVLRTEVSEERGRQLGGILTYEAPFHPPVGDDGYVNLPFSDFKAYLNGEPLPHEPGLGSADYGSTAFRPKSLAIEMRNSAEPDSTVNFRIRNAEVGAGFFFGLRPEEAAQATVQAAPSRKKKDAEIFAGLMLKLQARLHDFPEGREFAQLKTDHERREWLEPRLNKIRLRRYINDPRNPFHLTSEGSQQDFVGKVKVDDLWASVVAHGTIPTETGYFGALHGRYTHALQLYAALKDATPEELIAVYRQFENDGQFALNWNFFVDARTGGANDPAAWRQRYEPLLPGEDGLHPKVRNNYLDSGIRKH